MSTEELLRLALRALNARNSYRVTDEYMSYDIAALITRHFADLENQS